MIHEPKWDGFRFQAIKDGARVRFYSHSGAENTDPGDRGAAGVTRAASVKPQQVPRNAAPIVAMAVLTPPRPDKHRRKADQLMPVQA